MSGLAPYAVEFTEVVPAQTILASDVVSIAEAQWAGTLTAASYIPEANITGADSPASRTYSIINKGTDGNGTTVMATLAMTLGVDATDFNESALTLSAVEGATAFVAGDVLAWSTAAVGGTGLVDPGGTVKITLTRS
jgi:hypothetical protein